MGENLKISNFFSDPPPKYPKKFSGPPQVKSFFKKNNRYIKDEKSCYLLTVIYNSVPLIFLLGQLFHVIYKSMIKLPLVITL